MPIVQIPDGQQFNFPEGTSQEVMGGAIQKHLKGAKKQKAIGNIARLKEEQELESFGAKNIVRDVAEFAPVVGGYIDNIEAFARSRKSGDYKGELRKVRENQKRYGELVKSQGLGTLRSFGKIAGGLGGGLALPSGGTTKLGKVAFATAEGAIEGAGFGDEQAKAGALVGGALGGTIQGALGFLPTRKVNEVVEATGDIRKLASDNKTMNLLNRGIDSGQRIANNIGEVAESALKNIDDAPEKASPFLRKLADLDTKTSQAFGDFMETNGNQVLPLDKIKRLDTSELKPLGIKALNESLEKARQLTGADTFSLVNINEAKKVLDSRINVNEVTKNVAENRLLIKTKNFLNDAMRENFTGFKEIQADRAKAFQIRDAYSRGAELSPKSKRETLAVFRELTGKAEPFSSSSKEVQEAIKAGIMDKKIKTNLTSLVSKARNKTQARGSLTNILKNNVNIRNIGVAGVAGTFGSPALGAGVLAGQIVGKQALQGLDARTAKLLLSKQTPKIFRDSALSTILARGAGKKLGEQ